MRVDVIVVGAGPTGLLLAAELHLAGVSTVVLERLPQRLDHSRALGLQPRSARILNLRGLLEPLSDRVIDFLPGGHFAGIPLDYGPWSERQLGIPQARIEEFLETRLAKSGVEVLRGHEVTAVAQDADTVTVQTADTQVSARYLVACDGGRSTVRKLLELDFPGRDGRGSGVVADVTLKHQRPDGWRLPSFAAADDGVFSVLPLGEGRYRIVVAGVEQQTRRRDEPVSPEELRRGLSDVREVLWASRFTDASRQLKCYRHGRILFAGDAAHIHSPVGGQGLNLGLQDAFNLGWKLAAALRGNPTVLDTYHAERHPVAAAVLASTRAQGVLTVPDEDIAALRAIMQDLLAIPEANRYLAGLSSGLDIQYRLPGRHRWLGRAMPDLAPGALSDGRAVEVDASSLGDPHVDSALLRPDGRIGWVDDGFEPVASGHARWT